jgi:hypothetical protein
MSFGGGRSFVVDKYAQRELMYIYYSLREGLCREGYYGGSVRFDDLNLCIRNIKGLESN